MAAETKLWSSENKSGSKISDVKKPVWPFYDVLYFLANKVNSKHPIINISIEVALPENLPKNQTKKGLKNQVLYEKLNENLIFTVKCLEGHLQVTYFLFNNCDYNFKWAFCCCCCCFLWLFLQTSLLGSFPLNNNNIKNFL